jgi:hypothetical protein
MEGWIEIDMDRFENDVLRLMERFERLGPIIDRLLEERRAQRHLLQTIGPREVRG